MQTHRVPFSVKVLVAGNELSVQDECGYVGKLKPGTAELCADIPTDDVHGLHVDGGRNVMLKRPRQNGDGRKFRSSVTVISDGKWPRVEKENSFHLLHIREGGGFNLWEVSLASWISNFFLRSQLVHSAKFFRDERGLRCPYFERGQQAWPQFLDVCRENLGEKVQDFPELTAHQEFKNRANSSPHHAQVVFFSQAKLFGVVDVGGTEFLLVRTSQVPKRGKYGLPHLELGEVVRYERIERLEPRFFKNGKKRPDKFHAEIAGVKVA